MKFILLVYNDPAALGSLPAGDFDNKMRHCLAHAEDLKHNGRLIESQMLEDASTAKSVRIRNVRTFRVAGTRYPQHIGANRENAACGHVGRSCIVFADCSRSRE